ncbi:MAG: response regulator, partial [Hydrogenovibrio sp.]|nr:response regulator [Hydrogenovibrio sp.]
MIKALNIEQARILVVDDHQVNLKLVEQTLASGGFEHCLVTQDPLSVEELLHQHSIDLVLLDINMPMLDGFGVLEIIRKFYHSTLQPPVIMVTAQDDADKRIKSLTLGASDYISKPFNREELIKRISVHLENWFMKKQLMAQNQVLDQKVKERTQELEKAHLEVVFRLGRAAEYRDNETGNHVKRVSLYAEALARKIGLDEQQCHLIKIASPMHDIGKIGVS